MTIVTIVTMITLEIWINVDYYYADLMDLFSNEVVQFKSNRLNEELDDDCTNNLNNDCSFQLSDLRDTLYM